MVPKKDSDGGGTDDVYAKVRLLRQSVQEVNALLDEDRLRDLGEEERLRDSLPRQRRQHRSVPRGGCETPLDALIVPPPSAATSSLRSPPKKAVVSTRVTANISGKYQVRWEEGLVYGDGVRTSLIQTSSRNLALIHSFCTS